MLGDEYFDAIRDLLQVIEPRASLEIKTVDYDESDRFTDPLHIGIQIESYSIIVTFTSVALSGRPTSRVVGDRFTGVVLVLASLCADQSAAGVEFTLGIQDTPHGASVGFCTQDDCILIPDFEYLTSLAYYPFRQAVDRNWTDWLDRRKSIFWRGSTTGIPRSKDVYEEDWSKVLPRTEVCNRLRRSKWHNDCDVGISRVVQLSDNRVIHLINENLMRDHVDRRDQISYRYQLDIDGNSNAWAGLFQALLMGSCVMKVASEHAFRQWYYDRLTPWTHFIPIASDLSELETQVEWAMTHEDECLSIAARGYALSQAMNIDDEIAVTVDVIREHFLAKKAAFPSPS